MRLRFLSYLAPSLPAALFEAIARHVADATGVETSVAYELRTSGPPPGSLDPFTAAEADIGFLCAPAYRQLAARQPAAVELLAAPVFANPHAAGRPVLFSNVVIPRGSSARGFADLAGGVWAYNDVCSLSGYGSVLRKLAELGLERSFFRELRHAGSHLAGLAQVAAGVADAAAIDSNVLELALAREPALAPRIRVLETWGPFPVQPVVARATLPWELKRRVAAALLAVDGSLAPHGVEGFAPVTDADYADA